MSWNSILVTIAAGTPVRLANITTPVKRIRITPLIGSSTAVVYVLSQDRNATAAQAKTANNFITELAPATATIPGQMFELNAIPNGPVLDLIEYAVDGAHTGDTVNCSWEIG